MALAGNDINDLPTGWTPRMMLLTFFVGGLTLFNIPMVITGFGEEFGWRGFMFPQLYRIRPWVCFVVGGLIWFAWHVHLFFIMADTLVFTLWQYVCNVVILAIGSICMSFFFAYVYAKSGSIWVVSFVHAVFNNGSRSLSYFAKIENQLLANLGLTSTMLIVMVFLYFQNDLEVFKNYFRDEKRDA